MKQTAMAVWFAFGLVILWILYTIQKSSAQAKLVASRGLGPNVRTNSGRAAPAPVQTGIGAGIAALAALLAGKKNNQSQQQQQPKPSGGGGMSMGGGGGAPASARGNCSQGCKGSCRQCGACCQPLCCVNAAIAACCAPACSCSACCFADVIAACCAPGCGGGYCCVYCYGGGGGGYDSSCFCCTSLCYAVC